MQDHLYERKKLCPGLVNNVELTDEIKVCIIENRIYKIQKNDIKKFNDENKNTINPNIGDIYVYYTRACKNIDEPVYKIGKSYDYRKRATGYDKGGDMLFVVTVSNRHTCENIVKDAFKNEFKLRRDYGSEYFEGDIFEMVMTVKDVLKPYISETILEFDGFT